MKEFNFDRAEIGAVRKMAEANYFLDLHKNGPCRQEIRSSYRDKLKALYNKVMMRKGEGEL